MKYFLLGLGNPGAEYENTRHNSGRIALDYFRKKNDFPDFTFDKKINAFISKGKLGKSEVLLIEPETFMNNSGKSAAYLIKSKKAAENLVVIHDDLDLPLGRMKISFNRGSGGHKGVESIKRAVKTEGFVRVRVGISPEGKNNSAKKPENPDTFIIAKFKPAEIEELKKLSKKIAEALEVLIKEGRDVAMSRFN